MCLARPTRRTQTLTSMRGGSEVMYVRVVTDAPRNAASDMIRAILPNWSVREHVATKGREDMAADFVHEDRRRLVATPVIDADGFVEQMLDLHDIRTFKLWIEEVVAVRGERLALCVRGQTQDETWTTQRLVVVQFDEDVQRVERWVNFDLEQRDLALVELEHLAEEVEADRSDPPVS